MLNTHERATAPAPDAADASALARRRNLLAAARPLLARVSALVRRCRADAPPVRQTRRRLLLINLAVVSAILAVMAVAVYAADAHAIDEQVNSTLTSWVAHHPPGDHLDGDANDNAPPNGAPGQQYEPASPNVFSAVLDTHGNCVFDPSGVESLGLPDVQAARPVLSGQSQGIFTTTSRGGHEYRLYTVPVYNTNGTLAGATQAGMSLDIPDHQLRDLMLTLALVGLGVLALTALASVYLADRALVPMRVALERERQFSVGASHELRTPLAIVRSQADLVARRLRRGADSPSGLAAPDAAALDADVREIVDEVDYMTRLVRDLLTLARSDAEAAAVARDLVDLRELVDETLTRLRPTAAECGLTLAGLDGADAASGPVLVVGDADRLRQLLLILLDNALRYTPVGGRISAGVTTRRRRLGVAHRDEALLVVRDSGPGIAPADLPRIFDPFYRASASRTKASAPIGEHGGVGLGLTLARWIARTHGGEIAVESSPGAGATFTVSLPLAS